MNGILTTEIGNPFDVLERYLTAYRLESPAAQLPCSGGAVGYFSYDLCHFIEYLPTKATDDLNLPECYLGFYDLMLIFDNLLSRAYIVSTGFPETTETTV
jgi:para-aminobenzoate synthetase component 1